MFNAFLSENIVFGRDFNLGDTFLGKKNNLHIIDISLVTYINLLDQKAVVFVAIQMPSLQKIPELHLQLWQLSLVFSSSENPFRNCL